MAIDVYRGSITLPKDVSSEILAKTKEDSAIMKLAREIKLPGNGLVIPVITSDAEADWVTETDPKPVSKPGLTTKTMQAYKLAVIVPFSNEFRRDIPSLYNELVRRLPYALAEKFDGTVFGNIAKPVGMSNFDTFAAVTAQSILPGSGGTGTWAGLVAADADIAAHGGITNGFVLAPQGKSLLLNAVDANNRPLFINNVAEGAIPMILGSRTVTAKAAYKAPVTSGTTAPAVVGFAGDWEQAWYGTVEGVKVDISDQATLSYTENGSTVTLNLWQRNMFAIRAEIEVGFVADTTVFNKLTGAAS